MAIYKTDYGTYVIASGGIWLPGGYDSFRTARYAFHFTNQELHELDMMVNKRGTDAQVITMNDLKAKRADRIRPDSALMSVPT